MAATPGARASRARRAVPAAVLCVLATASLTGCTTSARSPATTATTTVPATTTTGVPATTTTGPTTTTTTATAGGGLSCGVVPAAGVTVVSGVQPCLVTATVGARIGLRLDAGFDWSDPTSDAASVLVEDVQRPPDGRGLDAVLAVMGPGQATVKAVGTLPCNPGEVCPDLARLWSLEVRAAPG